MYRLSVLTVATMVAAGIFVSDPASVEADSSANVAVARASNASFLYGFGPVDAPAAESTLTDREAVEMALARGLEIQAGRGTASGPNTRTLEAIFAAPEQAQPLSDTAWEVSGQWVNLRAGPGTGHAVVTQAGMGDLLEPLSETGRDWIQVRMPDGREAWIFGKYLQPRA